MNAYVNIWQLVCEYTENLLVKFYHVIASD